LKKDEISHIFYLENNISEGAFNENNLKILKALASQITISLENAVLYESLEQKVEQRTLMLQKALEEVEVKNTNIMHSIRYAQRIQEALLVSAHILNENFADSFIIYKPRDVVSGDFYWFAKHQEKIFLAAIDCTGHGVPGAFMSLISYNILQSVVLIHGEKDTDIILKKLNENLIAMLRQKETGNTDGMDIALISLENLGDGSVKKVSFSGAKRNFWFYDAEVEHLTEIGGDRKNIGGGYNIENNFTKHDFVISQNSVLFLFTDGFIDQSDAKSVRFGTKKFREIITENVRLPLDEMKTNLENALKLHQGKVAQRDDILVIGVKL
jgi:serine phosphatase RsbU (regulator of sigma subunit)